MQFLAPTNIFEGAVQLNSAPSADNHAVTKAYLEANSVVGIASDSANYAELVTEGGDLKLKLKPLTITDVSVDTSATSLANWIASNYTSGDEKQEGDIIILTNVSGRAQTFIHNGGTAGTDADWAEIEGGDVTAAEVRAALSASAGINYNASTGEFTADQAEIRALFAAGSGLSYDSSNGTYSLNVNSDGISEGSSNLYFTDARARSAISVSGSILSYNSGTGVISMSIDTGDIAESGNLYFTDARARAAVSVSGSGLAYNSGNGQISLTADTDVISEGSSNLYFTTARAQAAISADSAAGNMATVASGQVLVAKSSFRKTFAPQNLTANTFATLNHGLGEKIIHVSAYDSSGNLIQLDVQLVDANNVKVKSVINVSGAEIVVSL